MSKKSEEKQSARPLRNTVVIKEVRLRKQSTFIKSVNQESDDQFNVSYQIVSMGAIAKEELEKEEVKIGDFPIFPQHFRPLAVQLIEKNQDGTDTNFLVHYEEIIGIDPSGEILVLPKKN